MLHNSANLAVGKAQALAQTFGICGRRVDIEGFLRALLVGPAVQDELALVAEKVRSFGRPDSQRKNVSSWAISVGPRVASAAALRAIISTCPMGALISMLQRHRRLTFDMSGSREHAKRAGGCPLDGEVRPQAHSTQRLSHDQFETRPNLSNGADLHIDESEWQCDFSDRVVRELGGHSS
jgi:hypothetical protein